MLKKQTKCLLTSFDLNINCSKAYHKMIFNTNSHKLQNFAQYGPEGGHMWYKKKQFFVYKIGLRYLTRHKNVLLSASS